MKARIQKWGDSVALRIPKPFAEESNLREDSPVDVTVRGGKLVVAAIEESELSLDELVAKITPRNRHAEVKTGKAVGDEVW
jgi:antitoxin MazE